MRRLKAQVAALAVLLPILFAAAPGCGVGPPPKSATQFSAAATSLGEAELARLMLLQPNSTVLTSPLSIEAALAMVGQGARGSTLTNMQSGLGLTAQGLTLPDAAAGYAALRKQLTSSPDVTLALANGVWVDEPLTLNSSFSQAESGPFAAQIVRADLAAPATLASINGFVSTATKGEIPEVVSRLTPDAKVVLVNALYFKGAWAVRFETTATQNDPFTTAGGQTIQAPTMHREGQFGYYETDAFQSVTLPYKDPRFELVLVLMKTPGAAPAAGWTAALASQNYQQRAGSVALPRLDISWDGDLVASLRSVGLDVALGPAADYGGMATGPLAVGQVAHRARLVVDEEGTVGSAATVAEVADTACAPPGCGPAPFEFKADRPFWLLLREKTTGAPVFIGYVAAPS
jgi:serine protease inhibitor